MCFLRVLERVLLWKHDQEAASSANKHEVQAFKGFVVFFPFLFFISILSSFLFFFFFFINGITVDG